MTTAVGHLFRHLCGRVTEADIWDFRVDDGGCVRPWTEILKSRLLPAKVPPDFLYHDVTEPIKLYSYHDAETEPDPFRFRVYRLFIMTVACHLLPREGSDAVKGAHYIAINLLTDAKHVDDREITRLLCDVFSETATALREEEWPERDYPFFYAAEMVWAQRVRNWARADAVAQVLIREEQRVRRCWSYLDDPRFLWGLDSLNQLEDRWRLAFQELTNPNDCEETQLVIDALRAEE
jgi:hypothetical protein